MNRVYVTGDTHGDIDMAKLGHKRWRLGRTLSKESVVIILGDFGVLWDAKPNPKEERMLEWLNQRKYTVLFIDGNHDCHPRLLSLPQEERYGGIVGKVSNHVYHLRRGQIYTMTGQTFFTFGGALSYDKDSRLPGISWWPEEIPSKEEQELAITNLEKINWKVDYVLTHTVTMEIATSVFRVNPRYVKEMDPTWNFLSFIADRLEFKAWYFGHWHEDTEFLMKGKKYIGRYHQVTEVQ